MIAFAPRAQDRRGIPTSIVEHGIGNADVRTTSTMPHTGNQSTTLYGSNAYVQQSFSNTALPPGTDFSVSFWFANQNAAANENHYIDVKVTYQVTGETASRVEAKQRVKLNDNSGTWQQGTVYFGSVPASTTSTVVQLMRADVSALIRSAYVNGGNNDWQGPGITSSIAIQHAQTDDMLQLGFGSNNQLRYDSFAGITGLTHGANEILVRLTYVGDANLDGGVNILDFSILQNNFGGSGKQWATGDFNFDGTVNILDFAMLQNAFGRNIGGLTASGFTPPTATDLAFVQAFGATLVPEPITTGVLALTGVSLLARRRRRHCSVS